jgi:hypothetical protein
MTEIIDLVYEFRHLYEEPKEEDVCMVDKCRKQGMHFGCVFCKRCIWCLERNKK